MARKKDKCFYNKRRSSKLRKKSLTTKETPTSTDLCKDPVTIEQETRGQAISAAWRAERAIRLTASNFGTVLGLRKVSSTQNCVNTLRYGTFCSKNMQYGKENESKALEAFTELYVKDVDACGLFVDRPTQHPYLAASPDGLVRCENALVEVKCLSAAARENCASIEDAIDAGKILQRCVVARDSGANVEKAGTAFGHSGFIFFAEAPDYYRDAPLFRRIGDGPAYRLQIPHIKLDHTGTYSLVARNAHGEAKAIISLQVYVKGLGKDDGMHRRPVTRGKVETLPAFKKGLKDLRCCDGDAVTLECEVESGAGADVRWERGGKLVRLGGDVLSEFDGRIARLTINHVYPEDEGEYTCVAFNDLGHTPTSACLLVDVPEEKENALSQQLHRPSGLLSGNSTPRSTPRTTPSRSMSPYTRSFSPRHLEPISTPKRQKVAAPKFYAVPHNRVAEEGETVRFQCAIAGHPTPWVTWDKNGIIVTPSTRISLSERDDLRVLEISEVTVEDAGLYRITLENDVGRIEATARLEVIGPHGYKTKVANRAHSASPRASPSFRRRLVGGIGRIGDRINLACDIRGGPSPIPSWYRNGELVVMTDRFVPTWDGTTAMLEISGVAVEDAGVYTCMAKNELGRTQCSAELEVTTEDDPRATEPPFFEKGLSDIALQEGASAEIIVQIQGSTPMEVVWVRDKVEIPDCPDFRHVDYGNGKFGLRFADVFGEDAGHYTCEAFNQFGEAATEADIFVKEATVTPPLAFAKKPTSVVVTSGRSASFCARLQPASKIAAPRTCSSVIRWAIGDTLVPSGLPTKYMVEEDGDVSILHVNGVERRDAGQVTVVAQTSCPACRDVDSLSAVLSCGCGPATTAVADLTVLPDNWASDSEADIGPPTRMRSRSLSTSEIEVDLPKISRVMAGFTDETPALLLRGPADLNVLQGEKVVLSATYCGQPEPIVRWLRGGHEMKDGERVQIETGEGLSSLTITAITSDDSGKYVVSVENVLGADCHFASVSVEGPPDPPAGRPTVSPCSPTSVSVAWSSPPFDGGHKLSGYRVEALADGSNIWMPVSDTTDSLSTTISNLDPAVSYSFRVRAVNIHGSSEPGLESEICSLAPEPEPEDLTPVAVSIQTGDDFKARYNVLEELGKGRYGVVHKVVDTTTAQKLAAKFIRVIKVTDREKVKEEIEIMSSLRHPKLLQLAAAFESPREMVMVMEYISGGELFERVVADDFQLTERDCILFMRQICEGVAYMHSRQLVHLDLKPENIMCQTRTSHEIKLIDFGLAQRLDPTTPVRVLFGTPEFVPPEIINYEPIGLESDMWSVGVVCYVLLSGLSPFMGETDAETFANITRADFDFDDDAFDAISTDAKDFISSLLVKRKEKRLSATECLKNKWMLSEHEQTMAVVLSTDKLKKFIIRRKWQKTGNAIRALGRMANLSAASRRNSSTSSTASSPRPSIATSRLADKLPEEPDEKNRGRFASERSDSGFSDCSTATVSSTPLLSHENSIAESEEIEISPKSNGRRVSSEMDDKVEDIRKKFANLSQNIYEMDKKLESVGKKLGDIGTIKITPKKAEIKRTPSLKETKVPSLTIPKSPELRTSRLARSREQTPNRVKGLANTPPDSRGHTPPRLKGLANTPPHSRGHTPPKAKSYSLPRGTTPPHSRNISPTKTVNGTNVISVKGTKTGGVNSKREDFLRLQRMYDKGAVGEQGSSAEGNAPGSQGVAPRSRTSPTFHKTVAFWKR